MKVFFFEPYTINIPHYGTCLEIMIDHLKKGDEVWFLGCSSELSACDVNPDHVATTCFECRDRKMNGLRQIAQYGRVKTLSLENLFAKGERQLLKTTTLFDSIDELKKLQFEGFYDIGYGVASSIISMTRDPTPDTKVYADLVNRYLYSSKIVYKAIQKAIQRHKPDRVYAYNGRYAIIRPALRACQEGKIDIYLNEIGSDLSKYYIAKNELLHDIPYFQNEIIQFWNKNDETREVKEEKAAEYFTMTKNGISKNWYSFTVDQKAELPAGWNSNDKNIVFFTTSEDEFAAIGDSFTPPIYVNQESGITAIAESLLAYPQYKIWVRLHPNLKTAPAKLLRPYEDITLPNVTLISPDQKVSSYLLMDEAYKVITFGSTIGIEATFWKKVSILLGVCAYRGMDGVYEPGNHEETIECILRDDLIPKENTAALMYGYFIGHFGVDYLHFKKSGIYTGSLNGWDFQSSNKLHWLNRIRSKGIVNEWIAEKIFKVVIE